MTALTLPLAQTLLASTLENARTHKLKPCAVVVIDARGALAAAASEDGCSPLRWKVAMAKASGAVGLGVGSRKIAAMAVERAHFVAALHGLADGGVVPVPGGVLIRNADQQVIGAIGVSGDTSDNDEMVAMAAIAAAGLVADGG